MVKRFRQVLMGFALRTRGGSTSKNRDAVQTPREARRRDLHRAGTLTGSESFVFAARNWEFSARLDEQIKYFNWFSDLQTMSRDCLSRPGFISTTLMCFSCNDWIKPWLI